MNESIVQVLTRLENLPDKEKFWNLQPAAGNFLNMIVRLKSAMSVLEIGTSNGYSGLWIAEALSHNAGKLYTVESHRERFSLAEKHFQEAGVTDFVEQLFGHAPEIFLTQDFQKKFPGSDGGIFDIVFLDATKMEYMSYLQAIMPILKTNGLIIADNVISHREELHGFLDFFHENKGFQTVEIPLGGGLLLAYRI